VVVGVGGGAGEEGHGPGAVGASIVVCAAWRPASERGVSGGGVSRSAVATVTG